MRQNESVVDIEIYSIFIFSLLPFVKDFIRIKTQYNTNKVCTNNNYFQIQMINYIDEDVFSNYMIYLL